MSLNRRDRDQLASALRALATGKITNDQFEERLPARSSDAAVNEVVSQAWFLYDDLREYKLRDEHSLSRDNRRIVARCLLFLRSDLEYEFRLRGPIETFILSTVNLATLGLLARASSWRTSRNPAFKHWPFARQSDFDSARSRYDVNS